MYNQYPCMNMEGLKLTVNTVLICTLALFPGFLLSGESLSSLIPRPRPAFHRLQYGKVD